MNRYVEDYPNDNIVFFVSSNEKINPQLFNDINYFILNNNGPINDLYGLSKCNKIIAPPSTYSRWASFWGKKPICRINKKNERVYDNDFNVIETIF